MARFIYTLITVDYQGKRVPIESAIYQTAFASWLTPVNASLALAITFVLFWFGVLYVLYRKQIFFKV
jgi:predicted acyltransferase